LTLLKLEERAKAVCYTLYAIYCCITCKMGLEFSGVSAVKKMGEEILIVTPLVV
jgi:hypothetical protein